MASQLFVVSNAIPRVFNNIFNSNVGFDRYTQNFNVRRFFIQNDLQTCGRCGFPHGGEVN